MDFTLSAAQEALISAPLDAKIFVRGVAGTGKTTVGAARLRFLLSEGVAADSILVMTPQRTLQEPYWQFLRSAEAGAGGEATLATVGGLARRMIDLFWPLAAEEAGFARPDLPPVFLTLETAQYFMAQIVRPLLEEEGYFESLTMTRTRLYAQILDNLSKSAAVGFPYTEIGERLDSAWMGDPSRRRVYADVQECASRFREYCLQHNLLDFSLQLDVFWNILWQQTLVRDYLTRRYRHLIYDNVEEDLPRAHDLLEEWLPSFDSALLLFDKGGGYRRFLGADILSAERLADFCEEEVELRDSFVMSPEIAALSDALESAIRPEFSALETEINVLESGTLRFSDARFFPEMLDWVVEEIAALLDEGIPPSEIAVLAPYLSDALRFSLMDRLEARGIPVRSHRPSRSLRDEPASQTLLTWAALAHPQWGILPKPSDVAHALMKTIEGMDLVRARLLAEIVYRPKGEILSSFDEIHVGMQERITYVFGERYTRLREWILNYRESEPMPLDYFLRAFFGEVLSQPGFAFHRDLDAARVTASLVESMEKFRRVMEAAREDLDVNALGREYFAMLQEGVLAAQYLAGWREPLQDAVLLAPAYTFVLMNRPVYAQFWLSPSASGWSERLFQPLTHPYVLSREWEPTRLWTDADEARVSRDTLAALTTGLLRRCRSRLYLGMSVLNESGFEQRGDLLKAFQQVLMENA